MKRLAAFLLLAGLAGPVCAATVGGATFPDTYAVNGQVLHLNGMALRTLTILDVRAYVVGLYLLQPGRDPSAIEASPGSKVLLLQYLHAGSKAEIEKEYREGERVNCGAGGCPQSDQSDFERLVAAAPAVRVGDTTTYIFTPQGVRVFANNRQIGNYANPDLAHRLLDGFIGAHPPSPHVRDGLLGLGPH